MSGSLSGASEIAIGAFDRIYFVSDHGSSVRSLTGSITEGYTIDTIIGGSKQKDCGSGFIRGQSSISEFVERFTASASNICLGMITALVVVHNCAEEDGKESIYLSQKISNHINVIKLERPCQVLSSNSP